MSQMLKAENKVWWKEAVVYQIYPRSFKDTTGNGVGDLRGIIHQLDYIASLGVDAVWLNPIYPSPNDDGGYDISDYTDIQPEFGDMHDFDELLNGLHDRGIKLIMDLVLNHSSDEHEWFEESRKSKNNPYRNYYIWRPGQNGGPPNNWPSFFGGSAWEYDTHTDEYYFHLFSKKQPDLNWEFDPVREEVNKLIKFWLDRGVDGLRLDVISLISKRLSFSNSDTNHFHDIIQHHYANGPRMKEFLSQMRMEVFDQYNTFTIGEGPGITAKEVMDYLDPEKGLNIIFHFGHMLLDQGPAGRFDPKSWSLSDFKDIFKTWDEAIGDEGWTSVFLGNHDYPRMVSRWGNDKEYRVHSAKMLITLLLTLKGTPFIFQGDEIGMTNLTLSKVSESKDIETHAGWQQCQKEGKSEADF
jgi:oligo-1,6-glucosidase